MVLDGSKDKISPPPAPDHDNGNEVDPAVVDFLEFTCSTTSNPLIISRMR
jgi:hypothetical protein